MINYQTFQTELKNPFTSDFTLDNESFLSYIDNNSLKQSEKDDIYRTLMTNVYLQMSFFNNIKDKVSNDIKSEFENKILSYENEISDL